MSKLERPDRVALSVGKLAEKYRLTEDELDKICAAAEQQAVEFEQRRSQTDATTDDASDEHPKGRGRQGYDKQPYAQHTPPQHHRPEYVNDSEYDDQECDAYIKNPVDAIRLLVGTMPVSGDTSEMLCGVPIGVGSIQHLENAATEIGGSDAPQPCDCC